MRFGIVIGLLIGAVAAVIAKTTDVEPDGKGPIATVKRQVGAAVEAGKEEAAETEAEIMRQYEAARRGKRTPG